MERMMSVEDKIRRAEEIYYKRRTKYQHIILQRMKKVKTEI